MNMQTVIDLDDDTELLSSPIENLSFYTPNEGPMIVYQYSQEAVDALNFGEKIPDGSLKLIRFCWGKMDVKRAFSFAKGHLKVSLESDEKIRLYPRIGTNDLDEIEKSIESEETKGGTNSSGEPEALESSTDKFFCAIGQFDFLASFWNQKNHTFDTISFERQLPTMRSEECLLASFYANIWLGEDRYQFDLIDALKTLDGRFHQAITSWMQAPFYP